MTNDQMCIDHSRHLPLGVRLLEAGVTGMLWVAYLGVLSSVPMQALSQSFEWPPLRSSGPGFVLFAVQLLGVTLCCSSLLFLWARYNQLRFRGAERRRHAVIVSEKQLAECYGVGCEQIVALQTARRLVMHHDAEGRLTYVRYRRQAGTRSSAGNTDSTARAA